MDERPRSLRAMLAEAKDSSELMIDLAYAAVYFNDPGMATEVGELEERMNDLVQDMREVCIMAVRRPAEAEGMASVLQVISAIEGIANAAVDITRLVTHRLGIPDELIADLSNAEEISHRVWIREGSHMAHRPLKDLEIPVQCGMRVVAIRRERSWMIEEVDGDLILVPGDVLFLRGSPAGITRLHELAAAPTWEPPQATESASLSDLDRAVDVLVEMKNISEAAVGLAYSALALRDVGLAAEVRHLAERLDEMKDHLQLWVLRAAKADTDLSPLRGLLQLASAAEELGDQANHMVWLIADDYELHPIVKRGARRGRRGGGPGSRRRRLGCRRPAACRPPARHRARVPRARDPSGQPLPVPTAWLRRAPAGRRADRLRPSGGPQPARRALWLVDGGATRTTPPASFELVPLQRDADPRWLAEAGRVSSRSASAQSWPSHQRIFEGCCGSGYQPGSARQRPPRSSIRFLVRAMSASGSSATSTVISGGSGGVSSSSISGPVSLRVGSLGGVAGALEQLGDAGERAAHAAGLHRQVDLGGLTVGHRW